MSEEKKIDWEQIFIHDGFDVAFEAPDNPTKEEFTEHLEILFNQIDGLTNSFVDNCKREDIPVDCKAGCSWCCFQPVFALTHELLVINEYMHKNFTPDEIDEVRRKTYAKYEKTEGLDYDETIKITHACPFLMNNKCSIYPVRPLACRIYLSRSEKACIDKYHNPVKRERDMPLFGFIMDAGKNLNYGFVFGLEKKSLFSKEAPLEWIMKAIFENPDAFQEWLGGKILHESFVFKDER